MFVRLYVGRKNYLEVMNESHEILGKITPSDKKRVP